MDKAEMRILFDEYTRREFTQQAIPWCTAHDYPGLKVIPSSSKLSQHCAKSAWLLQDGGVHCSVSSGGPDHKWWVDV